MRREHEGFFTRWEPEARAVLEELLEKYAEWGVSQLDDLAVLEVPPLSEHGTPVEIAAQFGGAGGLRTAVDTMVNLIYLAKTA